MPRGKRGKPPEDPPPQPSDVDLPGMEDRTIPEIEELAREYAHIRDRRIALNKDEADLKARTLAAMHGIGKEFYKRDGVEIKVVHGDEDVKVKITADRDEDDDEPETPPSGPRAVPPPEFDDPRDLPPAPREEPPTDEGGGRIA